MAHAHTTRPSHSILRDWRVLWPPRGRSKTVKRCYCRAMAWFKKYMMHDRGVSCQRQCASEEGSSGALSHEGCRVTPGPFGIDRSGSGAWGQSLELGILGTWCLVHGGFSGLGATCGRRRGSPATEAHCRPRSVHRVSLLTLLTDPLDRLGPRDLLGQCGQDGQGGQGGHTI